jgi:hypothetical protein
VTDRNTGYHTEEGGRTYVVTLTRREWEEAREKADRVHVVQPDTRQGGDR